MRSVGIVTTLTTTVIAVACLTLLAPAASAQEDPTVAPITALSGDGTSATDGTRTLTVSTALIPESGATVRVAGSGYNTEKGVYVAFCVIPSLNKIPSPCGGGVNLGGEGGGSIWISSNPPSYGSNLAIPYGPGGSFDVQMTVSPVINDSYDCRDVACAVMTRSDHTRLSDRSQDIFVPITFGEPTPAPTAAPTTVPSASPTATEAASETPDPSDTSTSTSTASPSPTKTARATAAGAVSSPGDDGPIVVDFEEEGGGGSSGWILWAGLGALGLAMLGVGGFVLRQRFMTSLMLLSLALLMVAGCSTASSNDGTGPDAGETPIVVIGDKVEPKLPVTVTSHGGEEVTVTDVSRIVPLWGNITEVVFGLGLGDNVVGRDISTTFFEAKGLPLVTRAHDVSAESVLSLHPTVVLASEDTGPSEALNQIRNVGIPVIQFDEPNSVDDIVPRIRTIAAALGVSEAGEKLVAEVQADLDAVQATVPDDAGSPRVAFLYMRGQAGVYLIGGPGSGADSMVAAAGGIDAGTEMGLDNAFTPITSEALVSSAPDVILMTTTGLESVGGIEGLVKIPGIAQTPAGEARRVITIEDGLLYSFGPRTPRAIERLISDIYGS